MNALRSRAFQWGLALGFAVWAASPFLTGRREPWDARGPYYSFALLAGTGLIGYREPRRINLVFLGVWLGQVIAIAVLPGLARDSIMVGVVTTAIGSVLALAGAAAGGWLRAQRMRD
jgi:hypothetical protein